MTMAKVEGRLRVEPHAGLLAVWTGDPADPHGFGLTPQQALDAAHDLMTASDPGAEPAALRAQVRLISIFPPTSAGGVGRLRIETGVGVIDLLVDWTNLNGLAETARAEVMSVAASGST